MHSTKEKMEGLNGFDIALDNFELTGVGELELFQLMERRGNCLEFGCLRSELSSLDIVIEFEFLQSEGEGVFFEYSGIYVEHALSSDETCVVVSA
jgi:hypothetical protein